MNKHIGPSDSPLMHSYNPPITRNDCVRYVERLVDRVFPRTEI